METAEIALDRVRQHTNAETLDRIDAEIEFNVLLYARKSREELNLRINQLEAEWDIERVLETNASILALTGVVLGVTKNKSWLILSGGVLGFLLLHGVQGWCPPLPLLRKLGVRTRGEIDREKFALKFVRGDFNKFSKHPKGGLNTAELMHAVDA